MFTCHKTKSIYCICLLLARSSRIFLLFSPSEFNAGDAKKSTHAECERCKQADHMREIVCCECVDRWMATLPMPMDHNQTLSELSSKTHWVASHNQTQLHSRFLLFLAIDFYESANTPIFIAYGVRRCTTHWSLASFSILNLTICFRSASYSLCMHSSCVPLLHVPNHFNNIFSNS